MKWLCTLLAFLVLFLSVQPVCGAATETGSCCTTNSETCSDDEDADAPDEDACDNSCNPFQACSCCAFSALIPMGLTPAALHFIPFDASYKVLATISFPEDPAFGFWQPPRFAAC